MHIFQRQGRKVYSERGLEVWVKPLKKDAAAVGFFNRNDAVAEIACKWSDVGLPAGKAKARGVWAQADRGVFADSFKANVSPHGVVLLKVVSTK